MPAEVPTITPMMIDAKAAAAAIGVSQASWYRMVAAGKTPAPIKLSAGCTRWRVVDLQTWIDAGCPDRKSFNTNCE